MKNQHYYAEKHNIPDKYRVFEYLFNNHNFKFLTNSGVFSRDFIDFGSSTILSELFKLNINGRILEVGCGYGAITIPLAFFNPESLYDMIDINEEAVSLSTKNIKENSIKNIKAFKSDIYSEVTFKKYDCIYSNPPIRAGKIVTYKIYEESYNYLKENGLFLIVIQKKQGAESSITKLKEIYGNCEVLCKNKGYFVLKSKKSQKPS